MATDHNSMTAVLVVRGLCRSLAPGNGRTRPNLWSRWSRSAFVHSNESERLQPEGALICRIFRTGVNGRERSPSFDKLGSLALTIPMYTAATTGNVLPKAAERGESTTAAPSRTSLGMIRA